MIAFDARTDLGFERIIPASTAAVWRSWSEGELLARWWLPAPLIARVEQLHLVPGGSFVTSLSEDGTQFSPHMDAVFLCAEPESLIVFSNALTSDWRPAVPAPVAITAQMEICDDPLGTRYRVTVRHASPEERAHHEELGFFEGWGMTVDALAEVAAGLDRGE